jgi:hypothetical protein
MSAANLIGVGFIRRGSSCSDVGLRDLFRHPASRCFGRVKFNGLAVVAFFYFVLGNLYGEFSHRRLSAIVIIIGSAAPGNYGRANSRIARK